MMLVSGFLAVESAVGVQHIGSDSAMRLDPQILGQLMARHGYGTARYQVGAK